VSRLIRDSFPLNLMSSGLGQLTIFFTMFLNQLPILLVSLIGLGLVLTRWQQRSPALPWALMGFGLTLILCFAIPIGQVLLQNWLVSGAGAMSQRATVSTIVALVWSVLRAVTYGLLAMAIFVGQSQRKSGTLSPANRP
jgi:hypothetical protein